MTTRAQIAVDVYAGYVAQLASQTGGCARPETILTSLNILSSDAAQETGTAISQPDFDLIDAGVFYPANNAAFLAAHNANVAALQAALGG